MSLRGSSQVLPAESCQTQDLNSEPAKTLQVLLLCDDPAIGALLSEYLLKDKHCEYSITSCDKTSAALDLCSSSDYGLLLIDENIPGLSCQSFLRAVAVRSSGSVSPPAVILASPGATSSEHDAKVHGAVEILPRSSLTRDSLTWSMGHCLYKHKVQQSLEQRTAELVEMANDLIEKDREIHFFYQKVSHEIKTPLAAAREFVAIIRDQIIGPVSSDQADLLDQAITSCDQIATHFNDLVESTRLIAGKVRLQKQVVSIGYLMDKVLSRCVSELNEAQVKVTLGLDDPARQIYVDPDLVVQVLSIILGNAIKFSEPGSSVEVTAFVNSDSENQFCIADSGCGIEEQNRNKVFERLFQVGDNNYDFTGAGLGLGLSIARDIVELHQGKIWVDSEIGVGSEFNLCLPYIELEGVSDRLSPARSDSQF